MWLPITFGALFTETPIYYRYTPQKQNLPTQPHQKAGTIIYMSLLLLIYLPTVGNFPWFENLFPDFGWKPPIFPWFPWLEKVVKIFPDFPDQWEPCKIDLMSQLSANTLRPTYNEFGYKEHPLTRSSFFCIFLVCDSAEVVFPFISLADSYKMAHFQ